MEIFKRIHVLLLVCLIAIAQSGFAQQSSIDLILYAGDIRVEESIDEDGLIFYIRKKPGIDSVMLTESSESMSHDISTYALRAQNYNAYNGDERRILNGQFIRSKNGYFIVDSTPESDVIFGYAFVLFVPYEVIYGYQNTRNGTLNFLDESNYISIRSFEKMYADYGGSYRDNSFLINRVVDTAGPKPKNVLPNDINDNIPSLILTNSELIKTYESDAISRADTIDEIEEISRADTVDEIEEISRADKVDEMNQVSKTDTIDEISLEEILQITSTDKYDKEAIVSFTDIADNSGTKVTFLKNKDDIANQLASLVGRFPYNESIDMVLLFDTTRSMWDDISAIKSAVVPELDKVLKGRIFRIGIVLYRDFEEAYLTKRVEFNDHLQIIQHKINSIQAVGGGDWSEAIHEALKEAVENYTWVAENRIIVVIGDAPAHDPPRNALDVTQIYSVARAKNIAIYPFLVPRR